MMPVRREWRKFYASHFWRRIIRPRILKRAGGQFDGKGKYIGGARCESCGVPDHFNVWRWKGSWQWDDHWFAEDGIPPTEWGFCRFVYIILTIAHLDHDPTHNDDDNLRALCQWCHLHYDQAHHKRVREIHKDERRPLLQGAA